jgi:hypothetical protein
MNLITLFDSTKQLAAWRATGYGNSNMNWRLESAIPYKGVKALLFQARCYGETENTEHIVDIYFNGVRYLDEPVKNAEYKTIEYKNVDYMYAYPDLKTECQTRCSCSDYYFRWEYANKLVKALFGRLSKKYVRKTKTRPPVNPDHLPGICKHIYGLQGYLRQEGYIK